MSKGQICGICKSIYVEYCIIRLPANWKRQKYFEFGVWQVFILDAEYI